MQHCEFHGGCPGMASFFWSSLATGTVKHTAAFMARELKRVIEEVESRTIAVVAGVLTDNAPSMAAAWSLLERELPVFGGGCATHTLNLLMQDIFSKIPFVEMVMNDALAVTRFVREHHALLDTFRDLQQTRVPAEQARHALVIPVATRWYAAHACIRSVLYNREILEDIFRSSRHALLLERYRTPAAVLASLDRVTKVVESDRFWQNLSFTVEMIDPIIEALRELESDGLPASRVYERFKWLRQGYTPTPDIEEGQRPHLFGESVGGVRGRGALRGNQVKRVRAEFRKLIDNRWSFVHTNAMGIAFLLDPNTDPAGFIGTDEADSISQACRFATRTGMLDRLGITHEQLNGWLYAFADRKRGWTDADQQENEGVFPRHWWQSRRDWGDDYSAVSQLADLVFSIPTSSASSERAWSIFDYIHTKKRNRLSTAKVEMLASIYINSGAKTSGTQDLARLQMYPEAEELDIGVSNAEDALVV